MDEPTVVLPDGRPTTFDLDVVHDTEYGPRSHAEIHNVYGMLETAATHEGMLRLRPNERPLVITRSTYAGGQRSPRNGMEITSQLGTTCASAYPCS